MAKKPQDPGPELLLTRDGANVSSDDSPDYQKALASRSADTNNRSMESYKPQPVALAKPGASSIVATIQEMVTRNITTESVAALQQLCQLQNTLADREAKQAFESAFVALQHDMPNVTATRVIPDSNGGVRSTFAAFEDIMKDVQPLLKKHGFAIRFAQHWIVTGPKPMIEITCCLSHISGHSVTNAFAVPDGEGPPKSSKAQAVGAASTYAKRFALCEALNIVVVGVDDDARAVGDVIDSLQVEELKQRIRALGLTVADVKRLLKIAGANTLEEIRTGDLVLIENQLAFRAQTMPKHSAVEPLTDKNSPY